MTETKYKFDTIRRLNLWLLPTLFLLLIAAAIYSKFNTSSQFKLIDIIGWTSFFVFVVGIFMYLFFNHLPIARKAQLVITGVGTNDKGIEITQGDTFYATHSSDIKEIVEYSTSKLPWSSIIKWKIITDDNQITISSLTISKYNFERYFWNKIKVKTSLLPTI